MNPWIAYAIGIATFPAIALAASVYWRFQDRREARRYQRAWDKFGVEFNELTPGQLEFWQRKWAAEPERYARLSDDRSRYFAMRRPNWRAGEV